MLVEYIAASRPGPNRRVDCLEQRAVIASDAHQVRWLRFERFLIENWQNNLQDVIKTMSAVSEDSDEQPRMKSALAMKTMNRSISTPGVRRARVYNGAPKGRSSGF